MATSKRVGREAGKLLKTANKIKDRPVGCWVGAPAGAQGQAEKAEVTPSTIRRFACQVEGGRRYVPS